MRWFLPIASWLAVVLLSSGCAFLQPTPPPELATTQLWRGRLVLRVDSPQPQSFASAFELSGTAGAGELTLTTPWGTTVAKLNWSDQAATLRTPTDTRSYASFDEMIVQVLGSEIPVNALFSWLKGQPVSASGWQADLSDLAAGRITAKRTQPAPLAELRLTLEP